MLKSLFLRKSLFALSFGSTLFFDSLVAFAAEVPVALKPLDITESQTLVSDGQAIDLPRINAKITPPIGWEVRLNSGGFSAVMQEKKIAPKPSDKVIFQKNITLAVIQRGTPIDETRALELQEELVKSVATDPSATNFKVTEHKFFNYRGTNDGLMIYSSVRLGEFDMMQMHVLVSNEERQYLTTYTDFADQFHKSGVSFDAAWNAMTSLQIAGTSPQRYEDLVRYGSLAATCTMLLGVLGFIRSRRAKLDYDREADEIYRDESPFVSSEGHDRSLSTTVSGMWNLALAKQASAEEESEELWFTDDVVGLSKANS